MAWGPSGVGEPQQAPQGPSEVHTSGRPDGGDADRVSLSTVSPGVSGAQSRTAVQNPSASVAGVRFYNLGGAVDRIGHLSARPGCWAGGNPARSCLRRPLATTLTGYLASAGGFRVGMSAKVGRRDLRHDDFGGLPRLWSFLRLRRGLGHGDDRSARKRIVDVSPLDRVHLW